MECHNRLADCTGCLHKPSRHQNVATPCRTQGRQTVLNKCQLQGNCKYVPVTTYPLRKSQQPQPRPNPIEIEGRTHQKVINPPNTQNSNVAPTLLVRRMISAGVLKIAEPTTRLMIRNAVDHVPSFLSSG